ncbi:MAG TPA: ribonuclease PH [Kiritimatiellia bacterium]|nr:ribonuclease PH [Kiritimatiellia bacterium]
MTSTRSAARPDGRTLDALRKVSFEVDVAPAALGSVKISMGNTQVVCGVSVEEDVPRWMRAEKASGGWLTAEYSMLPYSTSDRCRREGLSGKVSGRTQEIQRLIGRSLRAIVDLDKLGPRTLWVDCDVLQADGGTRTASITGAYVAVARAIRRLMKEGRVAENPIREGVAAISVGLVHNRPMLDLCYVEDLAADVDMNVVMTSGGRFVEIQSTAEGLPFTGGQFQKLLKLAGGGIAQLIGFQEKAIKAKG